MTQKNVILTITPPHFAMYRCRFVTVFVQLQHFNREEMQITGNVKF